METRPFQIRIPDSAIDDLRERLARTRWPDEINDENWSYGTSLRFIQDLTAHWQSAYDWRAEEARLNRLPQFTADIDGTKIHFVHARGEGPRPFPLIISHGWPGSFVEMAKIIPLLTHPEDPADAFDVVVPSLPGFGFSGRPTAPGCAPPAIADIWAKLMQGLGYNRYGAQGGDWGSGISTWLAYKHPEHVAGVHLNFMQGVFAPPPGHTPPPLTEAEQKYLASVADWRAREGGYFAIQSTKPQTLGYALTDSPTGLAAWIAEKFRTWTDCNGTIENAVDRNELLTNISVYWFSGNITSAARIYKENLANPFNFADGRRVIPPLGFARFPKEISHPPRSYAERVFDVQRWTDMPRGGHFAAMEQPVLLAEEIRAFFRPLRS
jgi:pimeloyl-ACP methyl ester carboxylesterase